MRAIVLYNPTAGRGRGLHVATQAVAALERAGWRARRIATRCGGDAQVLAVRLGHLAARIVVVGGDGTLREVAAGVLAAQLSVELAIIPLGNANVVARDMGVPLETDAALECAVSGSAQDLDALRVNGRLALAMVGIGYDAQVTRAMDWARKNVLLKRWYGWHGDSLYALVGAACLFEFFPARFEIQLDGEPQAAPYRAACVSNLETYAKGWAMTPGAKPADGRLATMGRKRSFVPFTVLGLLHAAARKPAPAYLADYAHAKSVRILSKKPLSWQADGDYQGQDTELQIQVLPAALHLLVPAAGSAH
ncbi:MAG: diacylglycerol kinase (ATP) [Planctomycetota bacterium]|jgi:diacylglycerol kinase (ATP)